MELYITPTAKSALDYDKNRPDVYTPDGCVRTSIGAETLHIASKPMYGFVVPC